MPIISIPIKARDGAVKARKKAVETGSAYDLGYDHGFFDALRCLLPSEVVGIIVCDADTAAEGEELFSNRLPSLTVELLDGETS